MAAQESHEEAVTALLKAKADPNARRRDGSTLLHVAAVFGHAEAVTTLVNIGADPNAKDRAGRTPLDVADFDDPRVETALHAAEPRK